MAVKAALLLPQTAIASAISSSSGRRIGRIQH
jgi:hypothetical protein